MLLKSICEFDVIDWKNGGGVNGGWGLKWGASVLSGNKKSIPFAGTVRPPLLGDWLIEGVKDVKEQELIGYFCIPKPHID